MIIIQELYYIYYIEKERYSNKKQENKREWRIVLDADQGVMVSVYIYDYFINPAMYCVGFDDDRKKKGKNILLYYF